MERQDLSCQDTTWLVSDARERSLTPEEGRSLAEHIATCPFCSGASAQFEVLFRQLEMYFGRHDGQDGVSKP